MCFSYAIHILFCFHLHVLLLIYIMLLNKIQHTCTLSSYSAITLFSTWKLVYPIALRKAKIVYNFGLSECSRVK